MSEFRDIIAVIQGALLIGSLLFTWITARSAANANDIKAMAKRFEDAESRITKIESELRHVPDTNSIHEMQLGMKDLKAEMAVLTEKLKPIANMAERMQNHLLNQAATK